ncbi:MAG: hypothetical protein QOJ35_499 [Solirubrobacteraceae bacterium]|nr:hypothetical protein [Solirubrobacteraceae bacterium]
MEGVLDRALTQRIANAVSRGATSRPPDPQAATALPGDLVAICADAKLRVVTYTRLAPTTSLPVPEAIQRADWIAANVDSMGALLDPIGERMDAAGGSGALASALRGPARAATSALLSAEAGALTGYLSQRVLGQFEFAIADPASQARLLFVAPNIAGAAVRLEADAEQLLTWIAFHEVTHAVQFTAVPWLRPYLASLVEELLASLELKLDPAALLRLPRPDEVREMVGALREGGLVAALGGARRRDLLERIQGVMAVVEGHAEHVMDVVGAQALPSLAQLRSALDRRRHERPPLLALLERLIGLDAKLRQYEDGKRFCDAVARDAGPAALHHVFDGPEQLPTAPELQDPAAWMRRTGLHALAS